MIRQDVEIHLNFIKNLVTEMDFHAPETRTESTLFRGELAGLLVVSIASRYETCIKETIINHAMRYHPAFGEYASKNYGKINSKINISDLYSYTKLFGDSINSEFSKSLKEKKDKILRLTNKNIEENYKLILKWRHAYAHAGIKNTTIKEAIQAHRLAKHVVICFYDAFQ